MMKTILLVVLIAACGNSKPATGNKPPVEINVCTVTEDCVLADACCGCSAGGKRVAIRKDAVPQHDADRKKSCGDRVCAAVMSQDNSCDAEAACIDGRCKVMPHMGGAP